MSKKRSSEKELLDGITPDTAHADELATVPWDELGLEFSESIISATDLANVQNMHITY